MFLLLVVGSFFGFAILVCEEKRIRLNRKTPAHLAGVAVQSRPRVWKRLRSCVDFLGDSFLGHKRRRCDQDFEGFIPAQARTAVG